MVECTETLGEMDMKKRDIAKKSMRGSFWSKYFEPPKIAHPLAVRSLGFNRIPPHYRNSMIKHPYHHWFDEKNGRILPALTIVHVLRGGGVFRSKETGTVSIPENSVVFAFPNLRHYYTFDHTTGWDDEWVELDAEELLPLLTAVGIAPVSPIHRLGDASRVSTEFRSLFALTRANASPAMLAAQAYRIVATVLAEVADPAPFRSPVGIIRSELDSEDVKRPTSIAGLAKSVGVSASGLRSAFKAQTGLSPCQYRLAARLRNARDLIVAGKLSVAEVAQIVGYRTHSAFTKRFTAEYGLSPSQFRARSKRTN